MHSAHRLFIAVLACLVSGASASSLQAQAVSSLPRSTYYLAKELYGAGRTLEATEGFGAALAQARRVGDQRWIDSIPPLVMLGECHYQQGNLAAALEQYDAALMLAIANPGWINQVQVGVEQLPELEGIPRGIDWFSKSRPTRSVAVPEAVELAVDPTQAEADPQGVVVAPISLLTRLDATEVIRSMAIALVRRWEILGPLAKHSPLAEPLRKLFSNRPAQPVTWVQSSWHVLHGISQLSTHTPAGAQATIRRGVLLANEFDYFLTARAMLTLAALESGAGNFQAAIVSLQDAALLAAQYEQHDELSEALRRLAECAAASQRIELLEPVQRAAVWCTNRSNMSYVAALIGAQELAIYANNFGVADKMAKQATLVLRTREVSLPRDQARLAFTNALLAFGQNRQSFGLSNLESALKRMHGSAQTGAVTESVFQAQMTLNLLATGALTATDAEEVLLHVLAEPPVTDWQNAPLATLATITTASIPAYERLIELAVMRNDPMQTIARIDRLQRQVFFESLPLGGRLYSWRKAIANERANLPAPVQAVVGQTMQRFPSLQNSKKHIESLVQDLRTGPLPLDERNLPADSKKQFVELQRIAETHENQLAFHTLSRKPLDRFVPSIVEPENLEDEVGEGDLLLAMVVTRQNIFGVAVNQQGTELWKIDDLANLDNKLKLLLIEIGLVRQAAGQLPSKLMSTDAAWRTTAGEILDLLFPASIQEKIRASNRIILAPNQRLWYLPFELLPVSSKPGAAHWLAEHAITYVPTLGSLSKAFSKKPEIKKTVGIIGNFFATDRSRNEAHAEMLLNSIPNSSNVFLQKKISVAASDWLNLCSDQLWVATGIQPAPNRWDTVLLPLGASKNSILGSWLRTPFAAPNSIVLPGFQSTMRDGTGMGNGNEIFLPACGLLYGGSQTAVLSRWAVGGASTANLMQRYLEEREREPSSSALRRSILALWSQEFLVAEEPALLPAGKEASALTPGSHPLLWSGYMSLGDSKDSQ